jgi:arylsulfatase A-like enzyme
MFAAEEKLLLTRGHVPLLFYAPGQLKPAVFDKVGSQVDLLPSIAGMILPQYRNTTLGRDLLDPQYDSARYAFTIRHQYGPEIGLIGKDHVFRMHADGSNKRLFNIFSPDPEINMIEQLPDISQQMGQFTRDYYETIKYMRYHNGSLESS